MLEHIGSNGGIKLQIHGPDIGRANNSVVKLPEGRVPENNDPFVLGVGRLGHGGVLDLGQVARNVVHLFHPPKVTRMVSVIIARRQVVNH